MPSRSAPAFQFSQLKFDLCFSPRGFCGYFLSACYLTHLAIASLVSFGELCILLCYEVFVLQFRKEFQSSSHICLSFCLSWLNFVRAVNHV